MTLHSSVSSGIVPDMETPQKLRRGQVRDDGMIFWHYNGHKGAKNQERWLTPEEFARYKKMTREVAADQRAKRSRLKRFKAELARCDTQTQIDVAIYAFGLARKTFPTCVQTPPEVVSPPRP